MTAYTLGMRHAFDADHIAAIDNTTRKLMAEGRRPLSVGFWFSLGHSSVVFGLCVLLAFGVRALAGQVEDDASALQQTAGLIGTSVSGVFLYIIGIINLVVLVGIIKVFRRMRRGAFDEAALEAQLNSRGFMNRLLAGATRAVTKPWQMYPVGLLFGLGFDTATEVEPAGAGRRRGRLRPALVRDPHAADPLRRRDEPAGHHRRLLHELRLRLGVLQAGAQGLLQHHHHRTVRRGRARSSAPSSWSRSSPTSWASPPGPLAAVAGLDLNDVGYAIVALFVATWVVALAVWHLAGIEEKWSADLQA